jgi:hypothetical protein
MFLFFVLKEYPSQSWFHTHVIPALQRQREEDSEFKASVSYIASSKIR